METMTVQIREVDKAFVKFLCMKTGQRAGTKAFETAANRYLDQIQEIETLRTKVSDLENKIGHHKSIFNQILQLVDSSS